MESSTYHKALQLPRRPRPRGADTPNSLSTKLSTPSNRHFAQATEVLQPCSARTQDPGGESQSTIQKGNRNVIFLSHCSLSNRHRSTPACCAVPAPHPTSAPHSRSVPGCSPDKRCWAAHQHRPRQRQPGCGMPGLHR